MLALLLLYIEHDYKARCHEPRYLSDMCILNATTKETKYFPIKDWILMGMYNVTSEYTFITRGQHDTIF